MSRPTVSAILLAAGSSRRMGDDPGGTPINKLLFRFNGKTPVELCAEAFSRHCDELVFVVSDSTRHEAESVIASLSIPAKTVSGGDKRQDSVLAGLLAASGDIAAIHDCARALVSDAVIARAIEGALRYGSGAASVPVRDTVRAEATGETVPRDGLRLMQTPQCFERLKLIEAYSAVSGEHTDDASIWQSAYGSVHLTEGEPANQKLTSKNDIAFFERMATDMAPVRIGIGEDTHRLVSGRKLILGGVEVPFELGLLGHSDADALVHAIIDAMLGAAALGDIGRHFPDSDPQYSGISSIILLQRAAELLSASGYRVINIDSVITAQAPKLSPYIGSMRKTVADAIPHVGIDQISVKATTPEHTGPEGNLECITVRAVALIGRA